MKKRFVAPLLILITSLCISGCSFFNIISIDYSMSEPGTTSEPTSHSSTSETSRESGDTSTSEEDPNGKRELKYNISDYANRSIFDISVTPTIGNPKILVIPIWFTNSSSYINASEKETIKERLNTAIFGTKEETGWHSVKTYYEEESYGLCNLSGMVTDWYNASYTYDQVNDTSKTITLVNNAVNDWKSHNSSLIKEYDSNHDGFLDGVITIYGGPNYNNDTRETTNKNMWAYTSWTKNNKDVNNPNVKNFIWASYDFMDNYKSSGINIDTHTYIHETGHLFGLDDYYDYNRSYLRYDALWAAGFSMQDFNVGGHDPYSKILYGWVKPYVPTTTCTITINPFESSGDVILLTPEYTGSPYDEYILLELFTPTGVNALDASHPYNHTYDHSITSSGIRMWHVDSRLLQITGTSTQSDGTYYPQNYSITTEINQNYRYAVGPTNTTYTSGGANNDYASKASTLRSYKLLDLIHRNDTSGFYHGEFLANRDLFKTGDSFNINRYSEYFVNSTGSLIYTKCLFNNGKTLNWSVNFDSVSSSSATITFTKNG